MADAFATRVVTRKAKSDAVHLVLHIPEEVEPMDRGDRFEDPLDRALRKAGKLGRCVGGGTAFVVEPEFRITGCDVEIEVTDLVKALPVIQEFLTTARVPTGTTVTESASEKVVVRVTSRGFKTSPVPKTRRPARFRDSCPWTVGEVHAYRLTRTHYCLLHVYGFGGMGPLFWVPEWCGSVVPPPDQIRQLVRKKPVKYRLGSVYEAWRSAGIRPRDDRIVRTGVVVPPPAGGNRGWSPGIVDVAPWKQFERMLKEFFGLVHVSPARRLKHDLGLFENVPHLAVWHPTTDVTTDVASRLFNAHAAGFRRTHPDRRKHPVSDELKAFVTELKGRFDESTWVGNFSAREGFVMIPVVRRQFTAVRSAAESLADRHGLACYDPVAGRLRCRAS